MLDDLRALAVDTCPGHPRLSADTSFAGLIAPHAGYQYSGLTAACAYSALGDFRPQRVVVLAPSHQEFFDHISIWYSEEAGSAAGWQTPFGTIPVDKDFCRRLLASDARIRAGEDGHRQEHSLELQLPFLQHWLGAFQLVPVCIGHQSPHLLDALANGLISCVDETPTLIVASTDLSHFHNQGDARRLDQRFLLQVENMDHESLERELQHRSCEACGGGGVVVLLRWAKALMASPRSTLLDYRTSGDITGAYDSVVGYASALVHEGGRA